MEKIVHVFILICSLAGLFLSVVNMLRRRKEKREFERSKRIAGIVDYGPLLSFKFFHTLLMIVTVILGFSLIITVSIALTCLMGAMEWDSSVTLGVVTMLGLTGLLFGVILYLFFAVRRQYKTVETYWSDAIAVRADIKSLGSNFSQQPNLMQYEIILHFPDGDDVRVTKTDLAAGQGNTFLKKYDGKTANCYYSKSSDKILVEKDNAL